LRVVHEVTEIVSVELTYTYLKKKGKKFTLEQAVKAQTWNRSIAVESS
jgi:hypothetical protein